MKKTTALYLWSGAGYCLDRFEVEIPTASFEYAIEQVTAKLVNENLTSYFEEEDSEWIEEQRGDMDGDPYGWLYVDATMEGADRPVYLRIENCKFEYE